MSSKPDKRYCALTTLIVTDHTTLGVNNRNRVPYFRYFGPTAIVPGFKQMVVQVNKEQQRSQGAPSVFACSYLET